MQYYDSLLIYCIINLLTNEILNLPLFSVLEVGHLLSIPLSQYILDNGIVYVVY